MSNKITSLSQLFKPFTDRIKEILSNSKTKGAEKKYSTEEYEKDLEIVKSAFDHDLIDLDEYIEKKTLIKAQYSEINSKKQSYADAIIRNDKGEILLLRRSITDTFHPDCWSLPGGKIEKDEAPELAVVREVKEETNLDVNSATLLLTKEIENGSIFYFLCEVKDLSTIILDNDEHISYIFIEQGSGDWDSLNMILDLKTTLDSLYKNIHGLEVDFDLFPLFGKDKSRYSNIIEEIANIHPIAKDIFMLNLFVNDEMGVDDYVDYVEKAHRDNSKDDLTQLKGKDNKGVQVVKWVTKSELKRLAKHAKNSSHKDLEATIKESAHPQLREHAHAEIKRREAEEKIKEEKEGYEAHEYHGKDFKYSAKDNKHIDEEGNEADPAKLYQYYDQRHKEQDNKLKQLNTDLEGSVKQKQALGNKLKKAYYQKINKTRFAGDEESCYKTAMAKLEKMGMTEVDIEPERVRKIINKKIGTPLKKSEEGEFGENSSQKAKRIIEEQSNNN
jgi:mutator protein MutT